MALAVPKVIPPNDSSANPIELVHVRIDATKVVTTAFAGKHEESGFVADIVAGAALRAVEFQRNPPQAGVGR
jgi:hypothetical protein